MSRRVLAIGPLVIVLGLAGASLAFRRTTGKGQLCLWWGTRALTYEVNDFQNHPAPEVCGVPSSDAKAFATAVDASFNHWAQAGATQTPATPACTDLHFTAQRTSSTDTGKDDHNVIVVRRGRCQDLVPGNDPCWNEFTCADLFNCWDDTNLNPNDSHDFGVIALTTTTYNTSTGQILDADIELNGWDGQTSSGYFFTCVGGRSCGEGNKGVRDCVSSDVESTVTHEAGHFLGLAHPCERGGDPNCDEHPEMQDLTMFPSADGGEVKKRDLEPDDSSGICTVYPAGQKTANCIDGPCIAPCQPLPAKGGCGAGDAGLASLIGLGLLALRRGRAA